MSFFPWSFSIYSNSSPKMAPKMLALRFTLRLIEDKPGTHQNVKDNFGFE
jgi:hypothetical protein